jgi:hypothetical protein
MYNFHASDLVTTCEAATTFWHTGQSPFSKRMLQKKDVFQHTDLTVGERVMDMECGAIH